MFNDYGQEVPLFEAMGEANPLPRVFHGVTPYPCIPKPIYEIPVQFPADIFHRTSLPYDQGLFEICCFTLRF